MDNVLRIGQTRSLILRTQQLIDLKNSLDVLNIIRIIHNIQIDTISVVARAQDLTLFNRCDSYVEKSVWKLEKEGRLLEIESHALCLVPMEEYPFYLWIVEHQKDNLSDWSRTWLSEYQHVVDKVYEHVKKNGPTSSADFKKATKITREGWWDLKIENIALKILFHTGKLLVSFRKGFQRYYDLPDRVIPPNINIELMDKEELAEHTIDLIAQALGLISVNEVVYYLGRHFSKIIWNGNRIAIETTLKQCSKSGMLEEIRIEGMKDKYYVNGRIIDELKKRDNISPDNSNIKFLSPFDNIIRDRYFPKSFWNFDYVFEAYLPKAKRKYGFYLLPILDGVDLIGNMDAKVHRKEKLLEVLAFYINAELDEARMIRLIKGLKNFAQFNDCNVIDFDKVKPVKLKEKLISFQSIT
jgi:uncharacterized protein YcaQ